MLSFKKIVIVVFSTFQLLIAPLYDTENGNESLPMILFECFITFYRPYELQIFGNTIQTYMLNETYRIRPNYRPWPHNRPPPPRLFCTLFSLIITDLTIFVLTFYFIFTYYRPLDDLLALVVENKFTLAPRVPIRSNTVTEILQLHGKCIYLFIARHRFIYMFKLCININLRNNYLT